MDNLRLVFLLLSIFHVIGAAVLASALRDLWHSVRGGGSKSRPSIFLALWAAMFGCLPFAFGVSLARSETGTPLVLLGELSVWVSSFLVTLLAQKHLKRFLEPFLHQEMLMILVGGGFVVTGMFVLSFMLKESAMDGFVVGAISTLVGATVLGYGLWKLLRSTR